jgi:serine/threonine protein kinase
LDQSLNIKICDFGLARFSADLNTGSMQFSGTPAYMAPELFAKKSYDFKVDVFAFGTLLWELVTRQVPYDGLDASDIKQMVLAEEKLEIPYNVNKNIASLIHDC